MKLLLIVFSSVFIISTSFSQEVVKPQLSLGAYILSPYYFTDFSEKFNYGAGVSASLTFKRFKLSSGMYYSTKNYFSKGSWGTHDFHIEYVNVPIEIGINVLNKKSQKHRLYVYTGVVFNIPFKYREIEINMPKQEQIITKATKYDFGSAFRFGLSYHYQINTIIGIYSSVYTDISQPDQITVPAPNPVPFHWQPGYSQDKYSLNFNAGVTFILKKSKQR